MSRRRKAGFAGERVAFCPQRLELWEDDHFMLGISPTSQIGARAAHAKPSRCHMGLGRRRVLFFRRVVANPGGDTVRRRSGFDPDVAELSIPFRIQRSVIESILMT